MKVTKKTLAAAVILIVVIAALFTLWYTTRPQTVAGDKTITVQVVHGDGSTKSVAIQTAAETLGEALQAQEGLIVGEQGAYGLYIHAVDGEQDDERKQTWWCITKEGQSVNTSADTTPISDGEQYELTLKTGYEYGTAE